MYSVMSLTVHTVWTTRTSVQVMKKNLLMWIEFRVLQAVTLSTSQ